MTGFGANASPFRTDKKQHFSEKVAKVESILASDSKPSDVSEK